MSLNCQEYSKFIKESGVKDEITQRRKTRKSACKECKECTFQEGTILISISIDTVFDENFVAILFIVIFIFM